ncbi:MAG: V-type ATP synthase subunit B [Erysipelotrichaceae bacterium]
MAKLYRGLSEINGSLVVLDNVKDASFEEMVEFKLEDGTKRIGRIVTMNKEKCVVQVFEGTSGLSLTNTLTKLTGHPMQLGLTKDLLGRVFDGAGRPIDGLGEIYAKEFVDINGSALNPVSRQYPRQYINTGISSIDGLNTLIRGQKLPIFSGSGLPHNELAAQIVKQAKIAEDSDKKFGIVFAAMGVKNDVANYFKQSFIQAKVNDKVVMFINLANDPIVERIITPRCALSAAEYLAFKCEMHILVIMTDVTAYCEALREFSSSKGEIPGRKGYPGYLYSDLASLYERAGIIEGIDGSLTQIPILTMPNDDITHPVPDLTGYITEGQIVLDHQLHQMGVYPPVGVLASLSRLMKDGIGEGFTRADHSPLANQLFASYARVQEAKSLASVIGEDELSLADRQFMSFGRLFDQFYIGQGENSNRDIMETLQLGWRLLSVLPRKSLDRLDPKIIDQFYNHDEAILYFETQNGNIDLVLTDGEF